MKWEIDMVEIIASMVKNLREKTGAGMMDCKIALSENKGDIESSIDWLRTKGLSKAAKKAGRIAAEGLVAVMTNEHNGIIVEINSETDFVAQNDVFQSMVKDIAQTALSVKGDFDILVASPFPNTNKSMKEYVSEMIALIGENINLRRSVGLSVEMGVVASYIHGKVTEGQGKIGVLVSLESKGDVEKLTQFGRQIAMHIAATSPLAMTIEELDPKEIEHERDVLMSEARENGKTEEIIEKMIEGRLRKFYEEIVLSQQKFVIDPDNTVGQAIEKFSQEMGTPVILRGFYRFALGEGIDKNEKNFAEEVSAVINKS